MLVYGKNVLHEISKDKIRKAYISNKDYIPFLKDNNIKYEMVDNFVLNKKVAGNHQGIIMDIFDYEYYTINDIEGNLVVILDHLNDPHNFGAIIRTCECIGVKSIIIPKDRSVLVNDTVYKTSAGAINNVKIIMVTNLINAIDKLKQNGYFIYCADMDGENYKKQNYKGKNALIIGNEGYGVTPIVKKNSDITISLPMKGKINSLNASVAAAIILYEMGFYNE
ncbi:MAG: 23S rRNA (guanosine(2251)-2'-O)-methyltransferase RlmB [Mollicutes bacterium]|nr:23S rRNA (guanosine(2251)-2'-O)-methyltransferase RlmB [Mollicutes bacterium]